MIATSEPARTDAAELTAAEVRERFGLSHVTCYTLLNSGRIAGRLQTVPGTNIQIRVFNAADLEAYYKTSRRNPMRCAVPRGARSLAGNPEAAPKRKEARM
jgi:hypothetical protein